MTSTSPRYDDNMQPFEPLAATGHRACAFALSLFTVLLGACGGDGGGNNETPTPSSADYLVTGTISSNNGSDKTLLVVDPSHPDQVRLAVNLSGTENYQPGRGYLLNLSHMSRTLLGETMVYYVKNKQVFQVNLLKADTTLSKRISSLDTACAVLEPLALSMGGDDAWIPVIEPGPDGDCAGLDNGIAYVRTNTPVSTPATRLPPGITLSHLGAPVDDERFKRQYFLAHDARGTAPRLTLYNADLTPAGDVAGGDGITNFELQSPPTRFERVAYAFADGTLRRFSWSAAGATLSPALYTFKSSQVHSLSDTSTFFFVDGNEIRRVVGNGEPELLATLDRIQGGGVVMHYDTPTSLVFWQWGQEADQDTSSVFSLPKSGGALVTLASHRSTYVIGVTGEDVIYASSESSLVDGMSRETVTLKRIGADGLRETLITDKASGRPRYLLPATLSLTDAKIGGMVWCERAADAFDCRNGHLRQYDAITGATSDLGRLSHTGTDSPWEPLLLTVPYTLWSMSTSFVLTGSNGQLPNSSDTEHEMYVAKPGVADSLVRVTAVP